MAALARENSLDADVSAPGKRDIEQIADAQAEPPKRARTSESTAEPAAQPEEDARPSESAGDEAAPQEDEAAPQQEEDATPFSRGVALAEIDIKRNADKERADGRTELADAIEATIVTSAAQREAALAPRQIQGADGGMDFDQLKESLFEDLAADTGSDFNKLTEEETAEYDQREAEYRQLVEDYHGRVGAKVIPEYLDFYL